MKIRIVVLVIIIVMILFSGCNDGSIMESKNKISKIEETNTNELSHLKVGTYYDSIKMLVDDSPYIVEVEAGNIVETIDAGYNLIFMITEVYVIDVIKGDTINRGDTIRIFQTQSYEDPILEKNTLKVLFLQDYSSDFATDAYVCTGLYQGNYTIDSSGSVVNSYDEIDNVIISEATTKDEFINMISEQSSK